MKIDLVLPAGCRVDRVEALTPEEPKVKLLPFEAADGRLRFTQPRFLVYAIARVRLKRGD